MSFSSVPDHREPIELCMLGGVGLRRGGEPLASILAQPKRLALLAYVVLAARHGFVRRDALLALFWPEADTERGRSSLRSALYFLRRTLGEGVLITRGAEEVGVSEERLRCDAVAFQKALATGQRPEALRLYRGELLAGLHVTGAPEWSLWLDAERERLRRQAEAAARALSAEAETAGGLAEAARWARRAAELAPGEETPHRRLLCLLVRLGDCAAALRAHEDFARRLAAEYNLAPSAPTLALVDEIRDRQRVALPASPEPSLASETASPAPVLPPTSTGGAAAEPGIPGGAWRWPRATRRRRMVAAGLTLAAVLLIGLWWLRPGTDASATGTPPRVAVLPFVVHGTSQWAYLSEGMAELLASKLDGAGTLHTVDSRALLGSLQVPGGVADPGAGERLARRFHAAHYVLGSVVSEGGSLQLSASIYDTKGDGAEPRAATSVEGPASELPHLVDVLAARLLATQIAGPDAHLDQLAASLSPSLPALKAYLRGEGALRAGDVGAAVRNFEQAVQQDSTFALAWYRLSTTVAGSDWRVGDAAERAVRFSGRLPRHDQLLLRAWLAAWHFRYPEAEQLYRAVIEARPYDVEAWQQLGRVLFHGGPPRGHPAADAAPAFRRVLQIEPGNATALLYLARLAAREHRRAEFDSLSAAALARPTAANDALLLLGLRAVLLGDHAALRQATDSLRVARDFRLWNTVWDVLDDAEEPAATAPLLALLTDSTRDEHFRASGYVVLAQASLAQGRWAPARAALARSARLDPDVALQARVLFAALPFLPVPRAEVVAVRDALLARAAGVPDAPAGPRSPFAERGAPPHRELRLYELGLLEARLGDGGDALGDAVRLTGMDPLPTAGRMTAASLAAAVRAQVGWLRGSGVDSATLAAAWRERAPKSEVYPFVFPPAHPRFLRAELLRAAGRDAEAIGWYRSVVEDFDYALPYAAPVHLREAELLDRAGERSAASEQYRRFIALWGGADPALQPLVRRARRRLRELR